MGTSPSSVRNSTVQVEAVVVPHSSPVSQETVTSVRVDRASNAASTSAWHAARYDEQALTGDIGLPYSILV